MVEIAGEFAGGNPQWRAAKFSRGPPTKRSLLCRGGKAPPAGAPRSPAGIEGLASLCGSRGRGARPRRLHGLTGERASDPPASNAGGRSADEAVPPAFEFEIAGRSRSQGPGLPLRSRTAGDARVRHQASVGAEKSAAFLNRKSRSDTDTTRSQKKQRQPKPHPSSYSASWPPTPRKAAAIRQRACSCAASHNHLRLLPIRPPR